jgi:murein DD-endopeptidase MepM/ murein hydrolase activator NlpD
MSHFFPKRKRNEAKPVPIILRSPVLNISKKSDKKQKISSDKPLVFLLVLILGSGVGLFFWNNYLGQQQVVRPFSEHPANTYTFTPQPLQSVSFVMRSGEILATTISRNVPNITGVTDAINTLATVIDSRTIRTGQEVILTYKLGNKGESILQSIGLPQSDGDMVQAVRIDNKFYVRRVNEHITTEIVGVGGTVENNLYLSGIEVGLPAGKLMEMFDLFAFDVDFQRDIYAGDRFDMVYERRTDTQGNEVKAGNILAARLVTRRRDVQAFRFEYAEGEVDYFDRSGSSVRKALLLMPVQGGRLTSGYSARRNPVHGYSEFHPALDFAAPKGTPIMAAGAGKILRHGWDPKGYGNFVEVQHSNGLRTLYAHMSSFAKGAPVGARVIQGQTIGYVGSTGMSTGPHVHYEIKVNGVRQNPASVVRNMSSGIVLKGKQKEAFMEIMHDLEQKFY